MIEDVVLRADGLSRRHGDKVLVREATLEVRPGESVALMGTSGSGKTTLLHMLGLLDRPTEGRVQVACDGLELVDAWQGDGDRRAWLRLVRFGFVFQQSNLLPHLTALENVALPAWRRTGDRAGARERAGELLARLGLTRRVNARGGILSLGEAQRVAVARAIVNEPAIVLADEPTGSLDSQSSRAVLAAFEEVRVQGAALIVATHDASVAERMQRVVRIEDGRVVHAQPSARA